MLLTGKQPSMLDIRRNHKHIDKDVKGQDAVRVGAQEAGACVCLRMPADACACAPCACRVGVYSKGLNSF